MIPANLSLIPLSHERRAAMQAIAEVEKKYERGVHIAEFAYAHAFFRILNGSKRVTIREIRLFVPVLSAQELRGSRDSWLRAIDALIESRGASCWLPLPVNAGEHIFPEETFRHTERSRRQDVMQAEKYSRQRRKESCLRERAYQALSGQAEIELAFHTPETVGSWSARWSGSELGQYDLEEMFWRWSERFPSLSTLDQDEHHGEPLWSVVYEAGQLTADAPVSVRQLERWMVPNKLCAGEVRP